MKDKLGTKILSFLLVLIMVISVLPTQVLAESSWGNMDSGDYTVIPSGSAGGSGGYTSNLNSMNGYKISVWYAPQIGKENVGTIEKPDYQPIYDWENGAIQLGRTVYYRRLFLKDNTGKSVAPTFFNKDNIYQQTTQGNTWEDGYVNLEKGKTDFIYYATESHSTTDSLTGDMWSMNMKKVKEYIGLIGDNPKEENNGQKALRDWLARMIDMENPSSVDLNKYKKNPELLDTARTETKGRKMLTANDYQLPFPAAMKDKKSQESGEYVKSYFLNPYILNQISFVTRTNSSDKGGVWTVHDFLTGHVKYQNKNGTLVEYEAGQFKIYIEPVMFRPYDNKLGVLSWRDMMLQYEAGVKGNAVRAIAIAVPQITNALKLAEPDETLRVDGVALTVSNDLKKDTDVAPAAQNKTNGLGVGVITSPSINSYNPGPQVLKTYVMVDSVDADGTVHYKKAAESSLENAEFNIVDGNITQVPIFENIEGADGGIALLNDVVTTDKDLILQENTEWVNTDLPSNIGVELKTTSDDVAGYLTGIITGSELFIDTYNTVIRVDEPFIAALNAVKETYNALQEANAGVANETTTIVPDTLSRSPLASSVLIKVVNAVPYVYFGDVKLGKIVDDHVEKIVDETVDNTGGIGIVTPANNLILRYILKPAPSQIDIVEIRDVETNEVKSVLVGGPQDLSINEDKVTILDPNINNLDKYGEPELEEWVTNSEYPLKDINSGKLPEVSPNGQSGSIREDIENYPNNPLTHNLYVKWVIYLPTTGPEEIGRYKVPEWRLSKLFAEDSVIDGPTAMVLPITYGHCSLARLSPSGLWKYTTRNPNGQVTLPGHIPTNLKFNSDALSWIHAETVNIGSTDTVGAYKPTAIVMIDGRINAIKSTNTSGLKVANWLDKGSVTGLKDYDVLDGTNGAIFNQKEYTKDTLLNFHTLNLDTYLNTWPSAHYHKGGGHCHRWVNSKTISPLSASYIPYVYKTIISFDRYVQQNTDSKKLVIQPEVKSDNTFTTLKYQLDKTLNIYPEYGMLFANDAGGESIKWIVGDQARKVNPVVYQTLEHKVWVLPHTTGTAYATDSRAITKANSLGLSNKQVIYKGAGVNTAFQLYRDEKSIISGENSKAILTVKTYALDFDKSKNVKSPWGNDTYNSYESHSNLLKAINDQSTAKATEKLLIDSPNYGNVDYTGAIKELKTGNYNLMNYKNNSNAVGETKGEAVVFEHKLVVRGGAVIGIYEANRTGSNIGKFTDKDFTSMSQLKSTNESLYNAIVGMNLYNESIDRSKTVFSTFEHLTGDKLTEENYATLLSKARAEVDGTVTPNSSAVSKDNGWYSEDTTVLVLKEYVSNYEVPSISFGDKLSMSVKGLETPIDKGQFFNILGKGYTYLKYDFPIKNVFNGLPETSAYFEFSSFPEDSLGNGQQLVDYLVPNVSVSDTTRLS